jgi:cellulose synthase/poly-beta-1,6-N-acetylglucosamine synthase-like glycosyltransferase
MIEIMNLFVLLYFVALTAGNIAQFVAAVFGVIKVRRDLEGSSPEAVSLRGRATLPISIIVPAHNEEKNVVESVRALLNLRYPQHEVVVVNDGSADQTMAKLRAAFALEAVPIDMRIDLKCEPVRATYRSAINRRLVVIDKENGGKADALNCAVNAARYPLVCAIDADTLIIPDALLRLVRPFLSDLEVVGVGGSLCLANGCKIERGNVVEVGLPRSWLARFQVIEYMRAFLVGRLGWDGLGGNLIVSGAFGLFRRQAIVKAGGYATDSVGEDMELVARLRHDVPKWLQARAIRHLPDPVAFTEAPDSLRILGNQRDRWQRGLFDTLWRHKRMAFNPRYATIGLFVTPFFWIFELFGPFIEIFGYVYLLLTVIGGMIEPMFASLFGAMALLSGFLLSLGGILLEELSLSFFRQPGDLRRLLTVSVLENFGYRQMVLLYRVRGFLKYLLGEKAWGRMTRQGFQEQRGRNTGAAWVVPALATALVVALLAMPVGWLLKPRNTTRVQIVDKTVPLTSYREHARLMWLLTQAKVVPPSGRLLWSRAEDYVGYDPKTNKTTEIDDATLENRDILYIADTYGIYEHDFAEGRNPVEHLELNPKLYGGLGPTEVAVIERFTRAGGRLVAEFNSFASPTGADVRRRMEKLLHLRWTGWVGRWQADLADHREIAEGIRRRWEAQFGRKWDLTGPGLIFVHDSGRVLAVREGLEVARGAPMYLLHDGAKLPYPYWFDVVIAEHERDVRASYHIDALPAGKRLLAHFGIPERFPAVLHDDRFRYCYFAGDFADQATSFDPPWLGGITTVRRWMASWGLINADMRLTWQVYAPTIHRLLQAAK